MSPAVRTALDRRVEAWRREWASAWLAEGLARLAPWAAGPVLAAACLDAAVGLPLEARWTAFWACAASAAAGIVRFLVLPAARLRPETLLRAASGRHPGLAPFLLSAWELASGRGAGHTSEALRLEHLRQTERLLREAGVTRAFEPGISRPAARGAWLTLAAAAVLAPLLAATSPGLGRVLAPWREVPLDRLVEVVPGDARVAWGSAVLVSARWRAGAQPDRGRGLRLWTRTRGAAWSESGWDGEARGAFTRRLADLAMPVEYQVRWRDQRTRSYKAEPVPFPRLADARVRVHLPGRLAEGEAVSETELGSGGEVSALAGSWLVVRGRPTDRLSRARLRVSYLPAPVEFRARPSGELEAGFPLVQDGSFELDLASWEGFSDPRPVAYGLRALADLPPSAELLSPAFEVEASPREPLAVTFEARDDYGVSAVDLVYRVQGQAGPAGVEPVRRFGRHPTDVVGDHAWDLSRFPVGSRVEFQVRATDNNRIAPRTALSRPGAVRLVDFEAAHADMEREWQAAERRLEGLSRREAAAQRLLKGLSSAAEAERGPMAAAWSREERALAEEWDRAARALKDLSGAMSRDPYANPGMTEVARAVAEDIEAGSRQQLERGSKAAAAGDFAEAARRHEALEAEAAKAARLLAKGRHIQSLQDFWTEAQRMDQAGSDLAAALSSLAGERRAPSDEDRRKLDKALKELQEQMSALSRAIEALPKPEPGAGAGRERVYVVPLSAARREADALSRALAKGDYAAAAAIAKRLAEELGRVRQAIADAARSSSGGGGGGGANEDGSLSKDMEAAMGLWREVMDGQARSVAAAQEADEERTKALLEAQSRLLERLARRQKETLDAAKAIPAPAGPYAAMRSVHEQFSSGKVTDAARLLQGVVGALRAASAASPQPASDRLSAVANEEAAILEELAAGVAAAPTTEARVAKSAAAAAVQGGVRRRTAELESRVSALRGETAAIPGRAVERVAAAQVEQAAAMEDLNRLDGASAVTREEKALELLEAGMKDMESALESQRRAEAGQGQGFSAPRQAVRRAGSGGGMTGADTGPVPLPRAQDYQPPAELRRDLEQSLRERRPRIYDRAIRDYFRRLSQ